MTTNNELSQQEKMIRGTFWATAGNFISRLLGALYVIPWYIWMGQHGAEANGLFTMGYNVYSIFLLLSTSGVNVAVAKQVAKYNSLGQENRSFILVREFLKFMTIVGLVFAVIMFLGAPVFASLSGGGSELIPVMQSLAWGVLLFPVMSVIRGYFQGLNDLKPGAMSQIFEQIIRVIWMLLTTYFIMQIGSGDYVAAVTQSTFAAFVGMIASMAVLVYYLVKNNLLTNLLQSKSEPDTGDNRRLLLEAIKEAIPFIITGAAIQIFQLIDQVTFVNVMGWFTNFSQRDLLIMFTYFSGNPNKIIMILIAVASSIGGVGIALLTENYVKQDYRSSAKLIIDNLSLLLTFLIPALVGALIVSPSLYAVFYGMPDNLALGLFQLSLFQTLFLSLYTVLAPMLQALFQNRKAIVYFAYGVVVKAILQVPFIYLFQSYGPLLSTTIAILVPIVLMYQELRRVTRFNQKLLVKRVVLATILSALMGVLVLIVELLLNLFYPATDRISSIVHLVVSGGIGAGFYGILALRVRLLDKFIGEKAASLRQRFHIS